MRILAPDEQQVNALPSLPHQPPKHQIHIIAKPSNSRNCILLFPIEWRRWVCEHNLMFTDSGFGGSQKPDGINGACSRSVDQTLRLWGSQKPYGAGR